MRLTCYKRKPKIRRTTILPSFPCANLRRSARRFPVLSGRYAVVTTAACAVLRQGKRGERSAFAKGKRSLHLEPGGEPAQDAWGKAAATARTRKDCQGVVEQTGAGVDAAQDTQVLGRCHHCAGARCSNPRCKGWQQPLRLDGKRWSRDWQGKRQGSRCGVR